MLRRVPKTVFYKFILSKKKKQNQSVIFVRNSIHFYIPLRACHEEYGKTTLCTEKGILFLWCFTMFIVCFYSICHMNTLWYNKISEIFYERKRFHSRYSELNHHCLKPPRSWDNHRIKPPNRYQFSAGKNNFIWFLCLWDSESRFRCWFIGDPPFSRKAFS